MAENITLSNITTFINDTTAVNTVNNNNTTITTAFQDVLSRSGTSPNQMSSNLDMNGNQIINLPAPSTTNSPARLIDVVSNPSITIPPTGTSGHTVPFLDGNNVWTGSNTFGTIPGNVVFTSNPTVSVSGGLALINVNAVTASQQSAIDFSQSNIGKWQIGKQTDNSFFIFDIAGSQVMMTATTGGGVALKATTTNDNAAVGFIGELISSTVAQGSALALTSGVSLNVTSITLTPGDWDVYALPIFVPAGTTNVTFYAGGSSTTSATFTFLGGQFGSTNAPGNVPGTTPTNGGVSVGPARFSLTTNTTVFLVAQANFTVSTMTVFGTIRARRIR